jgi:hypothetical protein
MYVRTYEPFMSFKFTDDLSSDSDTSFTSAMDAEMTSPQQQTPQQQAPQQNPQQAPQQAPTFENVVNSFVELRAAGMLTNEQFVTVISALKNGNGAPATTPNDIEDQRIQQRLATITEFRGDKSDFHMAHRWILHQEKVQSLAKEPRFPGFLVLRTLYPLVYVVAR